MRLYYSNLAPLAILSHQIKFTMDLNTKATYLCAQSMRNLILIIPILLFLGTASYCQSDSLNSISGDVTLLADSSIIKLERGMRRFKEVKGYRVQIFLGPLEEAKAERNKYLSLGLPYSAYMKQIVPEHALQIGDFTTRMELDKCLAELEAYYPKAFSVVDIIEPPKSNGAFKPSR